MDEPPRTDAPPGIARRTALAAGVAGLGAAALASCSSSGSPAPPTPAGTTSTPPTSAGSAASTGSTSAGSAGSSSSAHAGGTEIVKLDSIPVGGSASAQVNNAPLVLTRLSSTSVACFSAICTHMGCTVSPADGKFVCPCHGSVYDAKTGRVLQGPSIQPLHRIPVAVRGGEVVTS